MKSHRSADLILKRALLSAPLVAAAWAAEARAADYYVTASSLNARFCADLACPVAKRLEHGAKVSVHERRGEWARISEFFDPPEKVKIPKPEESGKVARWVAARYLSEKKPAAPPPSGPSQADIDRRIHLPKPGQGGITAKDYKLLRRYARRLLRRGECTAVTNGDKSAQRPGTYFVTCANEYQSRFFTADDLR